MNVDVSHQNGIDEPIEETKEPRTDINIDPNVVRAIWPFLRPTEPLPSEARIKTDLALVTELLDDLVKKKKQTEQNLSNLLVEKPDCQSNTPKPFYLRETTLSSLQILEDIPCDYAEWVDDCSENSWVARTLKLWFFTRKNFALVHRWAKWPDIVHTNDKTFFKKGSNAIEDDVEELQSHLQKICSEMDLLNISSESLARIECLVEHLGGIQLCDPHADVVDSSIG